MDIEFLSNSKFKNRRVIRHGVDIEPQESLLDRLAQKKEEEIGVSEKKFEVPLSRRALSIFFVLVVVLFLSLLAKSFQLQVLEGASYSAKAQENKFVVSQIEAERGVVYDQNMNQLVYNEPAFDLVLYKSNLPDDERQRTLETVSQILGTDEQALENKINGSSDNVITVAENIDHETLIVLGTKISDLPGFEIKQDWVRRYVDSQYFSQVIGYTGKISADELKSSSSYSPTDWTGKAGLEKSYEDVLRKNPGELQIERDALGQEISQKVIEEPTSGNSLVLWLDSDLQKKITDTLEEVAKNIGVTNAAAIALDPKTGGVLSMVSVPAFDNNLFNKGTDQASLSALISGTLLGQSLYNLAIAGQFPAGSTIKPLLATGILQDNIISPDKKINCQGEIEITNSYGLPSTIKHDWMVHGLTDIRKAIAESCDVYFYTVAGGFGGQKGLGVDGIDKYLQMFGWGQSTGIDLPGENIGLVPSRTQKLAKTGTPWTDGDTYNISIGQGDMLVTPLQMAASFVPIANGGILYAPEVVQKVVDPQKNLVEDLSPRVIRQNFIDPQNLKVIREGMREAVTGQGAPHASSVSLNSLPVAVAAKTGTAQTGRFLNGKEMFDNWITVFAPYDDPQIVLTIMFQNVKDINQGATLPSAKEILQWYFTEGGGASGK